MEKAKISIIIPVYNSEPYLRKCLDGVVGQTYRNLEIILVDDGSPDNSGAVCDEYARMDDRIQVIHETDKGAPTARNIGLEIASGDWISFLDSDDYIERDQYEYLLDIANRFGADIAQCGAFLEKCNEREIQYVPEREICVDINHIADASPFFACPIWCRIYRRKLLGDIRFDPEYVIGDDLLFNLQALRKANKTAFGTQPKYHYVQRPGSLCNSIPDPSRLVSARNAILQAENEFIGHDSVLRLCRELRLRNNLDMCSKIVRYGLSPESSDLVLTIRNEMRELCKRSFSNVTFSQKEKIKSLLIAYSWPLYKRALLTVKGAEKMP